MEGESTHHPTFSLGNQDRQTQAEGKLFCQGYKEEW